MFVWSNTKNTCSGVLKCVADNLWCYEVFGYNICLYKRMLLWTMFIGID
jgi:hypothetical protein